MNEYEVKVVVTMIIEAEDESEVTDKALSEIGPVGEDLRVESIEKIWG